MIYYSLKHVSDSSKQSDQSCSEVTKHTEGQTSIHHPGSNVDSSAMTASSQPPPQDSVANYSISSIIHSLASERTSIENVQIHSQVNFEQERLRLEEKRLDFDTDLRERQYKLDLQRLEIERSRPHNVEARPENLSAQMNRIETKVDQIIQLLRLPTTSEHRGMKILDSTKNVDLKCITLLAMEVMLQQNQYIALYKFTTSSYFRLYTTDLRNRSKVAYGIQ